LALRNWKKEYARTLIDSLAECGELIPASNIRYEWQEIAKEIEVTDANQIPVYNRSDFASDQNVRWCPGCGDYSILTQVQKTMPEICAEMNVPKENVVFISGIGCSSRFPYYMDTYGFHTIHGRAPTIASGLKVTRPDLQVWVVTGDGDGLSIGANHLMHVLRRNIDINILLFNNRVYGLTKGQYSPTSVVGQKTKTSPLGAIAQPVNPLSYALASQATFVGRAIDTDAKGLQAILKRAAQHKGTSLVEIYQNCHIFNNGAFESFAKKSNRAEQTVQLVHGQPLVFGVERDKAIALKNGTAGVEAEVVKLDEADPSSLLIHDETAASGVLPYLMSRFDEMDLPVPLGVFRCVERTTYEELVMEQLDTAATQSGPGNLHDLLHAGETWEVSA
jgi:2-oxoglutarate ferredoxin oxidoreductase subunit beta